MNNKINQYRNDENLFLRNNKTNRTEYTFDRDQLIQNGKKYLPPIARQPIINNPINESKFFKL